MAALKIFILRVPMETLLSLNVHASVVPILPIFLNMYLSTFLPFEVIFSFSFCPTFSFPLPVSSHPLCFKILSQPVLLLSAVRLGCHRWLITSCVPSFMMDEIFISQCGCVFFPPFFEERTMVNKLDSNKA